jgi:hypothetical protein
MTPILGGEGGEGGEDDSLVKAKTVTKISVDKVTIHAPIQQVRRFTFGAAAFALGKFGLANGIGFQERTSILTLLSTVS